MRYGHITDDIQPYYDVPCYVNCSFNYNLEFNTSNIVSKVLQVEQPFSRTRLF